MILIDCQFFEMCFYGYKVKANICVLLYIDSVVVVIVN